MAFDALVRKEGVRTLAQALLEAGSYFLSLLTPQPRQ
jgi:hypothetical protein